jgi:DNA-binding MarR family transcriptional regulator
MSVIQERMIKTSNTTRLVDKLLLKNFVTRKVCLEKRKNRGFDYAKGLHVLEELEPKVIEHEQHFSKNLNTEELEQLNRLLEKYRNQ